MSQHWEIKNEELMNGTVTGANLELETATLEPHFKTYLKLYHYNFLYRRSCSF